MNIYKYVQIGKISTDRKYELSIILKYLFLSYRKCGGASGQMHIIIYRPSMLQKRKELV